MKNIFYDCRTGDWVEDLDTSFMAPELYFKIKESQDGKQHHIFQTDKGEVEIVADGEDFKKEFSKLQKESKYVIRKEWHIPTENFKEGCKYFGIK